MLNVQVVRTIEEHIDEMMIVENLSFKIPWSRSSIVEEITRNKFAIYLSAISSGHVLGYSGMWSVCDEGHITNIAIHPEFRRNGVGSLLLKETIGVAKESGINRMTLEVRKSNFAAQKLYSKFGFEVAGQRKNYYADNGEDALIMWKDNI